MIAAGISFGVVLLCMLLPNLSDIVPGRARYTYIVCAAAIILLAWFFFEQTKSWKAGVVTAVIGAAVLGLFAWLRPGLFDNGLSKIIDWFSVMDRFNDFCSGILMPLQSFITCPLSQCSSSCRYRPLRNADGIRRSSHE